MNKYPSIRLLIEPRTGESIKAFVDAALAFANDYNVAVTGKFNGATMYVSPGASAASIVKGLEEDLAMLANLRPSVSWPSLK
jgi:hypothetical protein